jgi:transcriptional regulator with XRE-family HTH domain
MAHKRIREASSWISRSKYEIEHEEELLACRLIVLKIVRYMKDHHLSQKDLAEKLNVSPQYINKFLHGQELDMKVSTIVRYGRILGIKLLEIPSEDDQREVRVQYGIERIAESFRQSVPSSYDNFSRIATLNFNMNQVTSAGKFNF